MSTITPEISSPPVRRRWHWTTWLIGTLVLLVCVMMNLGGDYDGFNLQHGWPWVYGETSPEMSYPNKEKNVPISNWWRVDHIEKLSFVWLMCDLAVVACVVLFVAALWEIRQRRLKHWLQFTILDWLLFCAGISGAYVGVEFLYADFRAESQLRKSLLNSNAQLEPEGWPQTDAFCSNIPWDWFWELLRVPMDQRPYRRKWFELTIFDRNREDEGEQPSPPLPTIVPSEALAAIARFRSLDTCRISFSTYEEDDTGPYVIVPKALTALDRLPAKTKLELSFHGAILRDEHLAALGAIQSLDELTIRDDLKFTGHALSKIQHVARLNLETTGIDDEGLQEINRLPNLKHLSLASNLTITTAGWQSLTNVKSLEVQGEVITEAVLSSLTELPNLESLELRTDQVSTQAWEMLGRMKHLKRLGVDSETFNNESLQIVQGLTKLESLYLSNTSITVDALSTFKKMRALKSLLIIPIIRRGGNFGFGSIPINPQIGITPEIEKMIIDQINFE